MVISKNRQNLDKILNCEIKLMSNTVTANLRALTICHSAISNNLASIKCAFFFFVRQ